MTTHLKNLFSEVQCESAQAIAAIGSYDHPLLVLLKQTLTDQQASLRLLLDELTDQSNPPLSSFKKECTHVYHANEVAMPFYESWARAVNWVPDESAKIEQKLGNSMHVIHTKLEEAAEVLEKDYGHMEVKYVIPTFYLPATK
ncbi:hypothetical protein PGH26_15545 [Sporosarcina jeotgali]|uniref:Uncharacterized protein n=1 Tax=Sporosarcina jeotgali TaxID=3020056 RepID=A0ABZ0KVQ7_9BACL|nr:hypothetical protein [Sporosarcina sp. B2O-1]WOV84256.1 hypothetical protein PGH26_15545 [Sporosarcina sp. B2O-1]